MRTIGEFLYIYRSVLAGSVVNVDGHTIYSDGKNWIVDDVITDSIENKKKVFEYVDKKCDFAIALMQMADYNEVDLFHRFKIAYDEKDGVVFLVNNEEDCIQFIHMEKNIGVVENIDKKTYFMTYDRFCVESDCIKQKRLQGELCEKSKKLLRPYSTVDDEDIELRVFYDTLFRGVRKYRDMETLEQSMLDSDDWESK